MVACGVLIEFMLYKPCAAVLLMDESGSVGLDLSFAGWVFLMEPVEEAALEAQVVARAHHMGAPRGRPIQVETLLMKARPPPTPTRHPAHA